MKIKTNHITALSIAVCLCYLAVFCVINFVGFCRLCTPDMYSDTYFSRVMWETGSFFPENWIFGNQFYVVTTPALAALFYGLCGSINLSMALSTTVMTLLILLSFWWMVRPFADRSLTLLGMAVLLGSVIGPRIVETIEGQIFYLMASYYAGYLISLFVVFGDYSHTLTDPAPRIPTLLLAAALSFCTGMQSLRQTAVMILPLVGFEALRLLILWKDRHDRPQWNWNATCRVALYTAANLAGCVAIKLLDPHQVSMLGELTFNSPDRLPELLSTSLGIMESVTGLKYLTWKTLPWGILALVLVLIVAVSMFSQFRQRGRRNGLELLMMLFTCSVLCVLGIGVVISIFVRSIYVFPWYPLVAVAAMALVDKCRGHRSRLLALLMLAVMMGNLLLSYSQSVWRSVKKYEPPEQHVAQYLMDEGYDIIYGTWWCSSCIAVWTDGQVVAGGWYLDTCRIIPYITPTDIFTEEDNAHACYVVSNAEEEAALLDFASESGATMTLVKRFDEGGYVLYTSSKQLMYFPSD